LRNSSVRFSPIVNLLCCSKCYQRSGIKLRQVQFEADWLLNDLDERGATAVIPLKTNRNIQRNFDAKV
jgi:hypothetical protein